MPTSRPRSESLSDITLTVQKHVNDTSNGSGEVTLTLGAGESFVDGSLVVASDPAAGFITSPSLDISTGVVSGLNNSTAHDIYYYVQKTGAVRSKTLSAFQTATLTKQTDAAGYDYYDFGVPDVYQLDSVREDDASGLDVITKVQLDDGQRDNFYADSRLIVSGNDSAPEAVYVKYKHFTRGAGDFSDYI